MLLSAHGNRSIMKRKSSKGDQSVVYDSRSQQCTLRVLRVGLGVSGSFRGPVTRCLRHPVEIKKTSSLAEYPGDQGLKAERDYPFLDCRNTAPQKEAAVGRIPDIKRPSGLDECTRPKNRNEGRKEPLDSFLIYSNSETGRYHPVPPSPSFTPSPFLSRG